MKYQIQKFLKILDWKKNTEYFFKSALIINLTYSINMKPHGKELEYAKKKI